MLRFLDFENNLAHAAGKYGMHRRIVRRICEQRVELESETASSHIGVSSPLKATYSDNVRDVLSFLHYTCFERLSVTMNLIRTRALMAGEIYQIPQFNASRFCVTRFLRRTGPQSTLELHENGRTEPFREEKEKLDEVR